MHNICGRILLHILFCHWLSLNSLNFLSFADGEFCLQIYGALLPKPAERPRVDLTIPLFSELAYSSLFGS